MNRLCYLFPILRPHKVDSRILRRQRSTCSHFLLTLGFVSNSPLQCRREGWNPVKITGVLQSGMELGPRTCRICLHICQKYFSIVQINSFRSSPIHSTIESQSFQFSLNIFSLSAIGGGPTHISLRFEDAPLTHINLLAPEFYV
jgi:hypothetical protein